MPAPSNKRVLIVDDAASTRTILRTILSAQGFECVEAETEEQAIKAYNADRHDLVTLDIHIDRVSGMGVLQVIRQIDPDARVIIVSTESDKAIIAKMMSLGAKGFVAKPFHRQTIEDAVSRALD
jgi:two-component system, chemotaxis family, chemotaxis protein CheY